MLSQHKSGNIFSIHTTQITQHLVKSSCIQQSSCSEYLVRRVSKFLLRNISQNIQRIGNNNNDRILCVTGNLFHNIVHYIYIFLQQNHAVSGISRCNARTCSDHNDLRIRTLLIATHTDIGIGTVRKCSGMAGIQHLSQCFLLIAVHYHNIIQNIHPKH